MTRMMRWVLGCMCARALAHSRLDTRRRNRMPHKYPALWSSPSRTCGNPRATDTDSISTGARFRGSHLPRAVSFDAFAFLSFGSRCTGPMHKQIFQTHVYGQHISHRIGVWPPRVQADGGSPPCQRGGRRLSTSRHTRLTCDRLSRPSLFALKLFQFYRPMPLEYVYILCGILY